MATGLESTSPTSEKRRSLVIYNDETTHAAEHERAVHYELGRRLAQLLEMSFEGDYNPQAAYAMPPYFLPTDTIIGLDKARSLGIATETDLFGGVVPFAFIATKAITHPLVAASAKAPRGWSHEFARRVRDVVPNGFTAFTVADAHRAGRMMLERGPVRIKSVLATAGRGQWEATMPEELDDALAELSDEEIAGSGVVLEEQLEDVATLSVGQVRVGTQLASYYGIQHLTQDNAGTTVYGGSELLVARGNFDALLALDLADDARLAVRKARAYDIAASDCFPEFFASRRNYDVVFGRNSSGLRCSGVLEQSWRVGGASSAEVRALQAFSEDKDLRAILASSLEFYGSAPPPPEAEVLYSGEDPEVGHISKCVMVKPYDGA